MVEEADSLNNTLQMLDPWRPSSSHNKVPVVVQAYLEVESAVVAIAEVVVSRCRPMLHKAVIRGRVAAVLEED